MDHMLPAVSTPALRAKNAAASAAVVLLACGAYALLPVHRDALRRLYGQGDWAFSGMQFLGAAALTYGAAVALWMLREREPGVSKSLCFFGVAMRALRRPRLLWAPGLDGAERVAVLSTLLKAFFGPLMGLSLMSFSMGAWANLQGMLADGATAGGLRAVFDRYGFWLALQIILFVDVAIFTFGYLIESPRLGNEIRSVDPTWLGWAAALSCYPPFNTVTAAILGAQHEDFPQFANGMVHVAANLVLLVLMAIYASASLALGFKGSNLTHRGIVSRGPYAWIRHPAYTCKNMAWWIGAAPLVALAFQRGWVAGALSLATVAGWTLLYVLRALTEEDHLRRVDGEYAAYAASVRHRFLPGLL